MSLLASVGRLALVVVGVAVVSLVLVRLVGGGRTFPLAALLTVLPYLVALGVVVATVAALTGPRPLAVVVGVAVLLWVGVSLPRVLPSSQPDVAGPTVTVAVANLFEGRADPQELVAVVADHDVDVLVTLELTGPGIERLADAGLDARLPHSALRPSARTSGGGIHSRWPLDRGPDTTRGSFGATPTATLTVPGAPPLELRGVHPLPPISAGWTRSWAASLGSLPAPDAEVLRVLAGDFNATHDHGPFRDLLRGGYVDAAAARGQAWRPTFSGAASGEPVPPVTLDHVLVDPRLAVRDVTVLPLPGSDHRVVVARLQLPGT